MNEELKITITAAIDGLKKGVSEAKKAVEKFTKDSEKGASQMDKAFKALGTGITNAMKGMATTLAAAGAAFLALGASTEEYRNQQAQLITAFEAAGGSAETATKTYNGLYRVLGDGGQAQEAAQHLAKLTTNQRALGDWTKICQGIYATFGASLPIEGLTEAANETAKTGQLTGALADALNWAGVNEEEFQAQLDACVSESQREALIRGQLNKIYGEAAEMYESNNAQVLAQRDAQAALQAQTAKLGEAVAPVITAFTSFAADALAVVVPYIQQLAADYLPLLQEALAGAAEHLGTVMSFLADNWDIIITIAAVIGGIAAAIGLYNTVAAVKAAMAALEVSTVWGLVAAYAAQAVAMAAALAPYILIVAAIAAVVAAIIYCVKHWDEIKAKIIEVWGIIKEWTLETVEKIKAWISELVEKVVAFFVNLKDKVVAAVLALKDKIVNTFTTIKDGITEKIGAAKDWVVSSFEAIKSGITDKITQAKSTITTAVSNIVSTFTNKFTSAKNTITNIFQSIKDGISNKINAAKDAVSKVIETIKGFFNFKFTLPSIPKPSFGITPQGWKVGDLLQGVIPKLSITWNAEGGVFDKPTLFNYGGSLQGIGEAGAEAVVPLERNTQWLDKIAERLAAKQGATPIVLTVDGKVFAQTSINSINQLTKQTGALALVMP